MDIVADFVERSIDPFRVVSYAFALVQSTMQSANPLQTQCKPLLHEVLDTRSSTSTGTITIYFCKGKKVRYSYSTVDEPYWQLHCA